MYTWSENDAFQREVQQAKMESAEFRKQQDELARQPPKQKEPEVVPIKVVEIQKKIEGIVLEDGLIHAKDGNMYFQDGTKVGGANLGH